MSNLDGIRAFTFDCYGTLIDWETGLGGVLNGWAEDTGVGLRNGDLLADYGRHEAEIETQHPTMLYSDVVREVLRRMSAEQSVPVKAYWVERLAHSIGEWPPFADSAESLLKLQRRFKLCVLSNVDHVSFKRSNIQLCVDFHLVRTAEDIGSYKPDLRNFNDILAKLRAQGIAQHEVIHVGQSLFHDHVPAASLGLKSIWINRRQGQAGSGATVLPANLPAVYREFASMRAFAAWACG
jgi:2-haloacid dehalogenase